MGPSGWGEDGADERPAGGDAGGDDGGPFAAPDAGVGVDVEVLERLEIRACLSWAPPSATWSPCFGYRVLRGGT